MSREIFPVDLFKNAKARGDFVPRPVVDEPAQATPEGDVEPAKDPEQPEVTVPAEAQETAPVAAAVQETPPVAQRAPQPKP